MIIVVFIPPTHNNVFYYPSIFYVWDITSYTYEKNQVFLQSRSIAQGYQLVYYM
jgi:hypothetical protein